MLQPPSKFVVVKALVGAFSVIVQLHRLIDLRYYYKIFIHTLLFISAQYQHSTCIYLDIYSRDKYISRQCLITFYLTSR